MTDSLLYAHIYGDLGSDAGHRINSVVCPWRDQRTSCRSGAMETRGCATVLMHVDISSFAVFVVRLESRKQPDAGPKLEVRRSLLLSRERIISDPDDNEDATIPQKRCAPIDGSEGPTSMIAECLWLSFQSWPRRILSTSQLPGSQSNNLVR